MDGRGIIGSREEGEDDSEAEPRHGENIDRQVQLAELEARSGDAGWRGSSSNKGGDGQDVCGEESRDHDGGDGVEGCCRADVDQTQQDGDDCGDQHGDDEDLGPLVGIADTSENVSALSETKAKVWREAVGCQWHYKLS